ncbi:hypothetical protein NP233_g12821 [Leucocoprinus birnbaumii]|uniref:F-box domain-containing protein n=1 Tax=Leucocoprinus birnbaumii TaxID=56174 RepID=A0AAD5YMP9_9AGAR|nr:hypothetical protein NP233_g12821 [Leucocoprinus birnbaumii]
MKDTSFIQPCWLITEILDLICAEIWYLPRDLIEDTREKTLVALARTCRAWSDVALDRLWHDIRGVSPLLYCLGLGKDANGSWVSRNDCPSTVLLKPYRLRDILQTIQRPLTDTDRATFRKYASRVRRLLVPPDEDTPAAHHALSLISDSCILPNLCRLEWFTQNPAAFHYIRQYLNPQLKEFSIGFIKQQQEQLDILSTIPAVFSPNIRILQVKTEMHFFKRS